MCADCQSTTHATKGKPNAHTPTTAKTNTHTPVYLLCAPPVTSPDESDGQRDRKAETHVPKVLYSTAVTETVTGHVTQRCATLLVRATIRHMRVHLPYKEGRSRELEPRSGMQGPRSSTVMIVRLSRLAKPCTCASFMKSFSW